MRQELLDDIEQMKVALQEAIADAQSAEEVTYTGVDGLLLSKSGGNHTYQFTLKAYWDIDENAKIAVVDAIKEQERKLKVDARVLSREANTLLFVTRTPLPPEQLGHVLFLEDKTWLLKRQLAALSNLQETSTEFGAKTLGLLPVQSGTKPVKGRLGTFIPHPNQEKAIAHGLGSEKTLVVGPPGTGKTTTLSDLICRYLRMGLSVLLVSHTNIATDNAFMRLIQAMRAAKKTDLQGLIDGGLAVRAGDPRHVALRTGSYRGLTVNALAEVKMGKQKEIRERLEKAIPELLARIEDLERSTREQEDAWRERREELDSQIAPLARDLTTIQAKVQEHECKEREFLAKKAKERQEAEQLLSPLQKRQQELTNARTSWVTVATRRKQDWENASLAVAQIRGMGQIKRLFSRYRDYDFAAANLDVANLLRAKEEADATIKQLDELLKSNSYEQITPTVTLELIDRDVQGFYNAKRLGGNTDLQRIEQLQEQLTPLQQEVQRGELQVSDAHAMVACHAEERDRIKAKIEELKAQQEAFKAQIIDEAQLVTTTITSVYLNAHLLEREFDVVVVDELSMISVIGVLLVASRALQRFVGAGDPMQLSPVVKLVNESKAPLAREWLGKDLFTYLGVSIFDAKNGEKECVLLTEQGRSHPNIIAPVNHLIYLDMLTSREGTAKAPGIAPHAEWPLMLVDGTGTEARCIKPSKNKPRENDYHARVSVELARQSLESLPPLSPDDDPSIPRVAIVAPYRSQVQLTQKKLREAKIAHLVHVGTINTVQSLEFPVVIFDTVEAPGIRPWEFTFDCTLDDRQMATEATRKLNVAWTRAQHKLIVIAHRKHLHNHLPHHMEEDPGKQRLLVDLVDWAGREGYVSAANILGS